MGFIFGQDVFGGNCNWVGHILGILIQLRKCFPFWTF